MELIQNIEKLRRLIIIGGYIFMTGCAINRPILIADEKAVIRKAYEVSSPGIDWQSSNQQSVHTKTNTAAVLDVIFTKCPGPKIIIVSRGVYRRPFLGKGREQLESFESVALAYLDEFYKDAKHIEKPNKVSHCNIIVDGHVAIEAIYKTKELFTACDDGKRGDTEVMNKFVIIEGGDRAAFWSWGLKSPRMVILWYASPIENFEEGLAEFDQMAQSFRYLYK